MISSFEPMLVAKPGKSSAQRSLLSVKHAYLFANVTGAAVMAGTATRRDAGIPGYSSLRRKLQNLDVLDKEKLDCLIFSSPAV